jgi:hypothetical protein
MRRALLLLLLLASPAGAGTITSMSLTVTLGALPPFDPVAGATPVGVGTGTLSIPFQPLTTAVIRTLPTTNELISFVTVTFASGTVTALSDGSGTGTIPGSLIFNILQLFNLTLPVQHGGSTVVAGSFGALQVTVTPVAAGWTTGAVAITGVFTETPATAVVNTLTVSGTPTQTGAVSSLGLVWAARTTTNCCRAVPYFARLHVTGTGLKVVPEPAPLVLLAAAAVLAGLGRRRLRSRRDGRP